MGMSEWTDSDSDVDKENFQLPKKRPKLFREIVPEEDWREFQRDLPREILQRIPSGRSPPPTVDFLSKQTYCC